VGGFALYLPGATPVPSEPHAAWAAQQAAQQQQLDKLIALLRAHLAMAAPGSADASEGEAYLGEALSEQAGAITPEALTLFKQSFASAPPTATWRQLDQQRLMQVQGRQ
jgi:cytochrome c-type biogenesis protein CcmH